MYERVVAHLPPGIKRIIKSALRQSTPPWIAKTLERRAERRYKVGKRAILPAEIRAAFARLPIPNGTVVFMHSAMSRLGYIEGGAWTIVDALCDIVVNKRKSTLAVPTFSMAGGMADSLRTGEIFDLRRTPSITGRVTELVRRHNCAFRSLHPTHSVAAIGPKAAWLTEAHHLDAYSFGPLSPFGRLIEADGHLLGLGTDLGPVTFYHTLEDFGPFPITVYTADSPIEVACRDVRGIQVPLKFMAHDPISSAVRIDKPNGIAIREYMTTVFEVAAGLTWYDIGDGRMWLISARRLYTCLSRLRDRGITIYAEANEVQSFPEPRSVLGVDQISDER